MDTFLFVMGVIVGVLAGYGIMMIWQDRDILFKMYKEWRDK